MGVSFSIHCLCQFGYFLIYLPGYTDAAKGYEKYRIDQGAPRHWENPKKWPAMRRRLICYVGLNYLVTYPLMVFASVKVSGIKVRFDEFPSM